MMKYRKKPIIVEAYQTEYEVDINTPNGLRHASIGDFIITGENGEKYPCKPDIFAQTYEPIGDEKEVYVVKDGKVAAVSCIDNYGIKIFLNKEDAEKAARVEDRLNKYLSEIENLNETINRYKELDDGGKVD